MLSKNLSKAWAKQKSWKSKDFPWDDDITESILYEADIKDAQAASGTSGHEGNSSETLHQAWQGPNNIFPLFYMNARFTIPIIKDM